MNLKIPRLPGSIWALGFVSMFMDISSEMIHGLLPVFITASLGASVAWVGVIDGVAEATAAFAKVFPAGGATSSARASRSPFWATACRP